MNKELLKGFHSWMSKNDHQLRQKGLHCTISNATTGRSKNSIYADIDAKLHMARIIVWDSGEYEIEVANGETTQRILSKYAVVKNTEELFTVLEELCQQLAELG